MLRKNKNKLSACCAGCQMASLLDYAELPLFDDPELQSRLEEFFAGDREGGLQM